MTFRLSSPANGPAWLPGFARSILDALNVLDRRGKETLTASSGITVAAAVTLVDATAGAVTVTLPTVASGAGQRFDVKKVDASGNAVVLSGDANIDGAGTVSMTTQYENTTVWSDGTEWHIL